MHMSDLHVGKRVNEFSMIEDQKYIFKEILHIISGESIDGILIAGDIYDKSVPSGEAVDVFDDFLTGISAKNIPVFIISGNHDSPERLNFGSRIMQKHNVHIAGEYNGAISKITMKDEFGVVNIFLMPYLKPAVVNRKLDAEATSFDQCVREALNIAEVDISERNILVAHQFVTAGGKNPETSDSETKSLGGMDNVDISAFGKFDYVALGHIHGAQKMGRDTVRYSGSPLKYSFSECRHKKSVTLITVKEKDNIDIQQIAISPKRDMKELRCTLEELQAGKTITQAECDAYVHITLTDEDEIVDAIGKVRAVYPNVMLLDFDNKRTKENHDKSVLTGDDILEKSPLELFSSFYENQNNIPMSEAQIKVFAEIAEKLGGAER